MPVLHPGELATAPKPLGLLMRCGWRLVDVRRIRLPPLTVMNNLLCHPSRVSHCTHILANAHKADQPRRSLRKTHQDPPETLL